MSKKTEGALLDTEGSQIMNEAFREVVGQEMALLERQTL